MNADELSRRLAAIASPQRMRIIAALVAEPLHVSALARRVEMSRALLYMHLAKLEETGFVRGHLELGDDGKALKFFEVLPFNLTIDKDTLVTAANAESTTTTTKESENL
ncbi:MAG: winged helix-turn-helix domain-containing protein [Terrimesophilobacter sp.]